MIQLAMAVHAKVCYLFPLVRGLWVQIPTIAWIGGLQRSRHPNDGGVLYKVRKLFVLMNGLRFQIPSMTWVTRLYLSVLTCLFISMEPRYEYWAV